MHSRPKFIARNLDADCSSETTEGIGLLISIGKIKLCTARLHVTSRPDEMVRDPRQNAEIPWAEKKTRPRRQDRD